MQHPCIKRRIYILQDTLFEDSGSRCDQCVALVAAGLREDEEEEDEEEDGIRCGKSSDDDSYRVSQSVISLKIRSMHHQLIHYHGDRGRLGRRCIHLSSSNVRVASCSLDSTRYCCCCVTSSVLDEPFVLPQVFHSLQYGLPVSQRGDAHVVEVLQVDVEQDSSIDVILCERTYIRL